MKPVIDYFLDNKFSMRYVDSSLNVVNYLRINYMEESKISITYKEGSIKVVGKGLKIKKLLDNEILVVGSIENIIIGELDG